MSAAATVLAFRYRTPRPCCAVNPQATPAIRQAQARIDRGLSAAETEMRAAGYGQNEAQHLSRMVMLAFLSKFDADNSPAPAVLDGLVDRLNREGWMKR